MDIGLDLQAIRRINARILQAFDPHARLILAGNDAYVAAIVIQLGDSADQRHVIDSRVILAYPVAPRVYVLGLHIEALARALDQLEYRFAISLGRQQWLNRDFPADCFGLEKL